jgi:hypothetical protein
VEVIPIFLSASTAVTYILTNPTCTTTIITLEPCALKASFSTSYPNLLKFPYFAHTTQRWDRGDRVGDFTDNFNISLNSEGKGSMKRTSCANHKMPKKKALNFWKQRINEQEA